MKNNKRLNLKLNAGTGMTLGIIGGAAMALFIQLVTGDSSVWSWTIPVGLAVGLAIGVGNNSAAREDSQ